MQTITLTITNVDHLPDGGPITYTSSGPRFEIGRDPFRDWALADPQLYISGRHCEIALGRDGYVLNDMSRNGTFVNGAQQRVKSPYLLRDGDTLTIGNYVILVRVSEAAEPAAPQGSADNPWASSAVDDDDIWGAGQAAAAPAMDRREFQPAASRQKLPDFVDSHLDMPMPARNAPPAAAPGGGNDAFGAYPRPGGASGFPPQPVISVSSAPLSPAPPPTPKSFGGREDRLLAAFCEGAKLSPHVLANRDAVELFREVGTMMLTVSDEVAQLLRARASARAMVRTTDRTMIGAQDNNPLKFLPGSAEALEAMLCRDRRGYLDGERAFKEAFEDLKRHEMATYAAMQKALARLLDDLSPESVESKVAQSPFSNRRAKAWETFVARWEAKIEANANGMLDVFLAYFSEAYQQMNRKEK
ncbi:type VI secretion system-associated FHA domain protein TagH [Sinorhizobium fredii]|uniref:type VI secretion system-associated FHA domain protein TagH n=1 Tax=Rhizobium fredii TaxID=380 RepID=UPI0004AF2003|nr:type VI secretion system-associated FHA domain protein TagH [Sinorhizobium fredii]